MIRKAELQDAKQLVDIAYIVLAELYNPVAENEEMELKQKRDLLELVKRNDVPMSYHNVTVFVDDEKIIGAVWSYDYIKFEAMLNTLYKLEETKNMLVPYLIEEAHKEDYYIDTVAVLPEARGKSVAKKILKVVIEANHEKSIALIVDQKKEIPLHIYKSLGFEVTDENEMYGSIYYYMKFTG